MLRLFRQWVTVGALASDTPISDPSPVDTSWMLFLQVPLKTQLSIVKCVMCVCVCAHLCILIKYGWLFYGGFPCGQLVKNSPAIQESWVRSLGWEDPLEKERLPTPVFFHGVAKSWTRLSDFHFLSLFFYGSIIYYYLCKFALVAEIPSTRVR